MKIVSYNIRKAVGRDRRRDPGRILDVIAGTSADVVVLQEADQRLGARPSALPRAMIEAHTEYVVADLAPNEVSLGFHGNAVLVRRGLEITGVHRHDLPSLEPRGAVTVEFGGRASVTGVHLGLMRRHRHEQMRALRQILEPIPLPSIIMGDFNEWSQREGMEEFAHAFHLHRPGASYPTLRPMGHLDRIAHSPEIRLTSTGVVDTKLARVASDHLPIWAEFSFGASDG